MRQLRERHKTSHQSPVHMQTLLGTTTLKQTNLQSKFSHKHQPMKLTRNFGQNNKNTTESVN